MLEMNYDDTETYVLKKNKYASALVHLHIMLIIINTVFLS